MTTLSQTLPNKLLNLSAHVVAAHQVLFLARADSTGSVVSTGGVDVC
jgi:hypothetical protein